ncbi:MAG: hypothetical protein H7Y11_04015 [Armatimonadetes bacterium]|nr:hypothetical protein [Anaerolineae bacterium]
MAAGKETSYIDLVQEHERSWGTDSYAGRPSLAELLSAEVVMFWQLTDPKEKRRVFTLHEDLTELDKYATRTLIYSQNEMPQKRLLAVFIKQKRARIRNVKVEVELPK